MRSETYKKAYNLVNSNLEILQKSDMNCMIVLSKAGLGKTTMVLETMKQKGCQLGDHYLYFNSYFTPLAFYQALVETTKLKAPQILILDDVELILKDKNIINLLKAATWQSGHDRIVCYSTTSKKVKETKINFTGKIILLLNEIPPKNPMFNAILDRSLFVGLEFNNQQILELMENEIVPKNYKNLSFQQRQKVFNYIKKITTSTTDLSFRTLIKAYNYFMFSPHNWQELVRKTLSENSNQSNKLKIII